MTRDERFMQEALLEAKRALTLGEIPVGAVIVRGDHIIAQAHNLREARRDVTAHAEILALQEACAQQKDWRLDGCELFVTLEPCAMCTGAILQSRISRVVFGAYDPAAGCFGGCYDLPARLQTEPQELLGGVCAQECSALLQRFFENRREKK